MTDDTGLNAVEGDDPVPPRRGRGRPSNAERAARESAKAEAGGTVHNLFESAIPKAPRSPKPKKNLDAIKSSIMMLHAMIALKASIPEMVLSEDEAHLLAEAGSNLLDYYQIKIDGKTGAIYAFLYAIALVYGPRAFAVMIRTDKKSQPDAT